MVDGGLAPATLKVAKDKAVEETGDNERQDIGKQKEDDKQMPSNVDTLYATVAIRSGVGRRQ